MLKIIWILIHGRFRHRAYCIRRIDMYAFSGLCFSCQWVYDNQSVLDSHPDLLVHILVKMGHNRSENVWQEGAQEGSKRSRSYKNNGPKRPESCKMGGGEGKKLNNTKNGGGGSNPQNIHKHWSIYDCITLSITSSKVHMYEGGGICIYELLIALYFF